MSNHNLPDAWLTGKQGHGHGGHDEDGRRPPLVAPYGLMSGAEDHARPLDTGGKMARESRSGVLAEKSPGDKPGEPRGDLRRGCSTVDLATCPTW